MGKNLDQSLAIAAVRRQRIRHIRKDKAHTISRMGVAADATATVYSARLNARQWSWHGIRNTSASTTGD
jgi:hypothetical protein